MPPKSKKDNKKGKATGQNNDSENVPGGTKKLLSDIPKAERTVEGFLGTMKGGATSLSLREQGNAWFKKATNHIPPQEALSHLDQAECHYIQAAWLASDRQETASAYKNLGIVFFQNCKHLLWGGKITSSIHPSVQRSLMCFKRAMYYGTGTQWLVATEEWIAKLTYFVIDKMTSVYVGIPVVYYIFDFTLELSNRQLLSAVFEAIWPKLTLAAATLGMSGQEKHAHIAVRLNTEWAMVKASEYSDKTDKRKKEQEATRLHVKGYTAEWFHEKSPDDWKSVRL